MQRKRLLKVETKRGSFNLQSIMEQFISFKKAQGLADRTIKDYQTTFKTYLEFSKIYDVEMDIVKSNVLKYFTKLSDLAPATYNNPYSYLNSFFTWSVGEEYFEQNPLKALGLKKKRDEGRIRNIDENIIKNLLESINLANYAGLRDYTLILLTLDTGIRPKEAFFLKISDIDFSYNTVTIRREIAKTRTTRILPLSVQMVLILKRLISFKPEDWEDFIFMTVEGYRMTINRWERRLEEYSKKINSKITPYDLRHYVESNIMGSEPYFSFVYSSFTLDHSP